LGEAGISDRTDQTESRAGTIWLLAAILLPLGFFDPAFLFPDFPFHWYLYSVLGAVALFLFALGHWTPLAFRALARRAGPSLRWVKWLVVFAIALVWIVCLPLALTGLVFAGPGTAWLAFHQAALFAANLAALHLLLRRLRGRFRWRPVMSFAALGFVIIASAVSIAHAAAVYAGARRVAAGDPFCLALHDSRGAPVRWIGDLRLSRFYVTKTGHKSTSRWYFHGVMIVRRVAEDAYFNWSLRHLRFGEVAREALLIERVAGSCDPVTDRFSLF